MIGLDCNEKSHLQQNPYLSITQVMPTSLKEQATDTEIENEILRIKSGNQEEEVNFNENFMKINLKPT